MPVSAAREALDHLSSAVADRAGHAFMLAASAAMPADILARSGSPGRGLIAWRFGPIAHADPTPLHPTGSIAAPPGRRRPFRFRLGPILGAALLAGGASPAAAGELFGGITIHDVDGPLNKGGYENGLDVQAGWRGAPIVGLRGVGGPSPYVFVSLSTNGGTNLGAAGISWKIGDKIFVRPGFGLAIHDRSSNVVQGNLRGDFGSRILFAPELGLGIRLGKRLTAEATWLHVSNGGLFSKQNPGMDNIGVRLSLRL